MIFLRISAFSPYRIRSKLNFTKKKSFFKWPLSTLSIKYNPKKIERVQQILKHKNIFIYFPFILTRLLFSVNWGSNISSVEWADSKLTNWIFCSSFCFSFFNTQFIPFARITMRKFRMKRISSRKRNF